MAGSLKLTHVAEFPDRCISYPGQIAKEIGSSMKVFDHFLKFGDSAFHEAALGKAEEHALGSTTGRQTNVCCKIKRINTLVT